ncbi:hypothetical protein M2175_001260 [Bradyrhizobium elkanii]|uniref:DUF6894 family protein n=1 Tax=Bradyrhizobium TaxID=374 RepID=UPI002168AEB6|nr:MULTISPECIES: hypothetical protein [Bradyrhizobium]MCS3926229.1 hypothetical protein [Bradyrhizobium elkanii]MCS3966781.1 hypothetical protein [Bradyrhizobium japonicum]
MSKRYFFHVQLRDNFSVDQEGTEFAEPLEADNYGAQIASEIGMDDGDYRDAEVLVVDADGCVIARHPVQRKLQG